MLWNIHTWRQWVVPFKVVSNLAGKSANCPPNMPVTLSLPQKQWISSYLEKESLQVWSNQGTYPRKTWMDSKCNLKHPLEGKEWQDPWNHQKRDRVVQPHPRESKEFCPKVQEPKPLPYCPKENATLLLHAGREWSPLILKYQCGIYLVQFHGSNV